MPKNYEVTEFNEPRAEPRQGSNLLEDQFKMPSFFSGNWEEPAFAKFNPPFGASGMFVDFLKTVGDVSDTIPFQESRTYVEEEPRPTEAVQRYGALESDFQETPR